MSFVFNITPESQNILVELYGKTNSTTELLCSLIKAKGLTDVFNPSVIFHEHRVYLAFRARECGELSIKSFILIANWEEASKCDIPHSFGCPSSLFNLSDLFCTHSLSYVADPKLFLYRDCIWCTFNTGYDKGANSIYLFSADMLPRPRLYKARLMGRRPVEKNWGFWDNEGTLSAVYDFNSRQIIKLVGEEVNELIFEFMEEGADQGARNSPVITNGSMPVKFKNGRFLIMLHEKHFIRGARVYLGRLGIFELSRGQMRGGVCPFLFIHSISALFGESIRLNPNLLSCTYFSGLAFSPDGQLFASYGVNDLDFNIAPIARDISNAYQNILLA
jgi:hypothetical protein